MDMTSPARPHTPIEGEIPDTNLEQEFEGGCQRDMEKAKAMLHEYPTLLNSAHDRGADGFTHLHWAEREGEEAVEVKDYKIFLGAGELR